MSLQCPDCEAEGSLEIRSTLQLQKDQCQSEVTLQIIECHECQFSGLAVFEEGRRGAGDTRAWKHTGYRLGETDLNYVRELILACPKPFDPTCDCLAHSQFGICDSHGVWIGLEGFDARGSFPIRLNV